MDGAWTRLWSHCQSVCMQGEADVSGFEGFGDWQYCFVEPGGRTVIQVSSKSPENAMAACHQIVRGAVRGSQMFPGHGCLKPTPSHPSILAVVAASKHQTQEGSLAEQPCTGCSADAAVQQCSQGEGPLERHAEVPGARGRQQGRLLLSGGPHRCAAFTAGGGRHAAQACISKV